MGDSTGRLVTSRTYVLWTSIVVGFGWGWYLLEQFTNLRVSASGTAHAEPIPILVPAAITVVAPLGAYIGWRRAIGIVRHGVAVEATVVAIAGGLEGLRDVRFAYSFDGREYERKMTLSGAIAGELEAGDPLPIVVHARKPTRVMVPRVE